MYAIFQGTVSFFFKFIIQVLKKYRYLMVYHKILKLLVETLDYFQSGLLTNPTKEINLSQR